MRFQKEVYEKYRTCSAKGKHIDARTPRYDRFQCPDELTAMLRPGKRIETEELGIMEIPVSKIVGIASICGKESYAGNFLPIASPKSSYAEAWCNIYLKYLNDVEIAPILCYEYLGKFYVIDGKKRVSVMKCNNIPLLRAKVMRIYPVDKESPEAIRYSEFLKTYETTGMYQIDFCPKYTLADLHKAIGCDVNYKWNQYDRAFMQTVLQSVNSALKLGNLEHLSVNAIDAFMVLLEEHSYQAATQMNLWEMAKCFKKNKKLLMGLYCTEKRAAKQIA